MSDDAPAASVTTAEQDRETAGSRVAAAQQATRTADEVTLREASRRAVNLMWETTQMRIAFAVIGTALLVACVLSVGGRYFGGPDVQLAALVFIFGVANLVTGFYFGRTNHTKTGGVDTEGRTR
jgi:hypothetical protein